MTIPVYVLWDGLGEIVPSILTIVRIIPALTEAPVL